MTKTYICLAALAIAATLTGCGHNYSEEHHHHDKVQITAYSPEYEVYAEATPLAVGEECEILVHFTSLPSFQPLEAGTVTLTLTAGGQSVSQTVAEPHEPGIYHFDITPTAAGDATMTFEVGPTTITATGLTVYDDEHEAEEAAEEAAVHSSNAVAFTKEMSWKVVFSTEPVERRPMGQIIKTVGQVEPSQGDVRTVTAKSGGTLTYASATLTDGQSVTAGQALFRIDGSGMADGNLSVRFQEAKSNYEATRAEYERKTDLAKDRLVTASDLARAKQEYESAKAVYDNLRGSFAGGASNVAAPISGYITQLAVTNGQYVEAGAVLATVAQNRDLFIKAEVQPQYYPYLSTITGATFRRPNSDMTYTLGELDGAVVSYGKAVDNANPLLPVVFRVSNRAGWLPGTFVDVTIQAGEQTPVLAVPRQALIEEMGNYFVYVQLTPEYFEKREVTIGRTDGRYTEILGGLIAGERVVARGAVLVKLAHSSGTLDAHSGHVH